MNTIARTISWFTGMHVWFPVLLAVSLLKTGLSVHQIEILFPILLFFLVIVPILFVTFALKQGSISAWDLPKREERYRFFVVVLLSTFLSDSFVYLFGNRLFFSVLTMLFVLMLILGIITRFWKISLHTSLITASALVINFFFHWDFPLLYFLVIPVVWARYTLKRHTIAQMVAGIVVSGVFILSAFRLLGYL